MAKMPDCRVWRLCGGKKGERKGFTVREREGDEPIVGRVREGSDGAMLVW